MHCVSRGGCCLVNSYCDIQEENHDRRESYRAYWLSVVMETRPEVNLTLSETDNSRRESYRQQQVAHFMVQRSLSQTLKLGGRSRFTLEHHLPLGKTAKGPEPAPVALMTSREPAKLISDDREASSVNRDLSKPVRMNFRASSLMSSPRETSHRVQRRE